jgi:hypothetical protein
MSHSLPSRANIWKRRKKKKKEHGLARQGMRKKNRGLGTAAVAYQGWDMIRRVCQGSIKHQWHNGLRGGKLDEATRIQHISAQRPNRNAAKPLGRQGFFHRSKADPRIDKAGLP